MTFEQIGLCPELLKGVKDLGFETAMPVQEQVIPTLLENDCNLIALAQTGTGKTAAFGLPLIEKLNYKNNNTEALIICPTRELCIQITNDCKKYAKYIPSCTVVATYGGASIEMQIRELKKGAKIIVATPGRYGGTYAHKDIAFEFASWLSPEFKFYLIREYQRLKDDETDRLKLGWSVQRTLSKINYRIHTDAIKDTLIPPTVTQQQMTNIYASEADLLNVAMFGMTAIEWRMHNPDKQGNMRDYATLEQLVVLSNMESLNAVFIRQGLSPAERLHQLNQIAITQMRSLIDNNEIKRLTEGEL